MDLIKLDGSYGKKKCRITVSEDQFLIEGDFYYLKNKEFYKVNGGKGECSIKEFLGLGKLKKRSPKKLIRFVVIGCVLELFNAIAGKLSDYLFFIDTSWTSYFVNAAAILCLIAGLSLFFSKKKVYEISFISKRFCVDMGMYSEEDMLKLDHVLSKLR